MQMLLGTNHRLLPFLFFKENQKSVGKPQPPLVVYFSKKYCNTPPNMYCNTPPICIEVLLCHWALWEGKKLQYSSRLYRSTLPICIAVRLPFCIEVLLGNLGGCGHRDVPQKRQGKPPKNQGFLYQPNPNPRKRKGKTLQKTRTSSQRKKNREFQKNKERKDRAEIADSFWLKSGKHRLLIQKRPFVHVCSQFWESFVRNFG